jgi:hypothetical protein
VPHCTTLARVMKSKESSNDSTPSDSGSHILGTLDDGQMGLVLSKLVIMPHTWAKSPLLGRAPRSFYAQRMEDVAFAGTLISLDDEFALLWHQDVICGGL